MISIMNAGRGAGKTYQLIEWAKKADNRYVVGTHTTTGDAMEDAGLSDKFVHYIHAKRFFEGRRNVEVAFDDFERMLGRLIYNEFGVNQHTNDVILSSNFADADLLPPMGFSLLTGDYTELMLQRYNTKETNTE